MTMGFDKELKFLLLPVIVKLWKYKITFNCKTLIAIILFTILSFIAIGANPFANETVGPFDLLVSNIGFSSVATNNLNVRNYERSDVLDSVVPYWIQKKKEMHSRFKNLEENKFSLFWDFYELLWQPDKMFFICISNNPFAYYLAILSRLIIAGAGAYLFLRLFLSFSASVWGGMVYMLCGFHAAWLYWPQVRTSIWIPWVFWSLTAYLKTNKSKYLFILTLLSAFMLRGGYPPIAAFGFFAIALFILLFNIFNYKNIRSFFIKSSIPFLFIALGILISSDYIFSLINLLKNTDLTFRATLFTPFTLEDIKLFFSTPSEIGPKVETSIYIGSIAFILSLISIFLLFGKRKSKNALSVHLYSTILLIISTALVFGLIPNRIINKISGLAFKPLPRLSVFAGLSIAFMSSFFIDKIIVLLKRKSHIYKTLIGIPLITIFIFQFVDQKTYFNKFNGPTPSHYFYPETPSIEFVTKNIKDLQSIMADYSFNIPGTLYGYNLFEWYHHGFKTVREKELLLTLAPGSNVSPTAFILSDGRIDFSSPLMDLLAVKYIMIDASFHYYNNRPGRNPKPSPTLPSNKIFQFFHLTKNIYLSAIELLFGTYRINNFDSDILLTLYNAKNDKPVSRSKLNKENIKDNEFKRFSFDPPIKLEKGHYKFSLTFLNKNTKQRLSIWTTHKEDIVHNYLSVNGHKVDYSFRFILFGYPSSLSLGKEYIFHRIEPDIIVVENLNCPEGPFLISDLENYPPIIKKAKIRYASVVSQ